MFKFCILVEKFKSYSTICSDSDKSTYKILCKSTPLSKKVFRVRTFLLEELKSQISSLLPYTTYKTDNLEQAKNNLLRFIIKDAELPLDHYLPVLQTLFTDSSVGKRSIFTDLFYDNSAYLDKVSSLSNTNLASIKALVKNQRQHFSSLSKIGKYIHYFQESMTNESHLVSSAIHKTSLTQVTFSHLIQNSDKRQQFGLSLNTVSEEVQVLKLQHQQLNEFVLNIIANKRDFCHYQGNDIFCSEGCILENLRPLTINLKIKIRRQNFMFSHILYCLPNNGQVYSFTGQVHITRDNKLKLAKSGKFIPTNCLSSDNVTTECEQFYSKDISRLVPSFKHFNYFIIGQDIYAQCNESLLISWTAGNDLTCGDEITQFKLKSLPAKVTLASDSSLSYFIKESDFLSRDYSRYNFDSHFLPVSFKPQYLDFDEEEIEESFQTFDPDLLPDIPTYFAQHPLFRQLSIGTLTFVIILILTLFMILACCCPQFSSCLEYLFCCKCCKKQTENLRVLYTAAPRR